MKRRIWTVAVALASVTALIAVPSAFAAYTTAKLEVRQTGTTALIKATLDPNDDPTASVRIFVPTGTTLTTTQAPGTSLGPVRAIVKALDLAGADLPLEGNLVVAAAGQIAPTTQAACLGSVTPIASWVMVLSAAGQTLPVPAYLVATTGTQAALGPAYIQVCLPPPDIPAGTPGRATFGAKLYSAELTINGVFSQSAGRMDRILDSVPSRASDRSTPRQPSRRPLRSAQVRSPWPRGRPREPVSVPRSRDA